MYEIPEPRDWLEPPEPETIGYCEECGGEIFSGEDVWEIHRSLYCEACINDFKTRKYEKERYF